MKPTPITVTDLNKYIKDKVADDEFLNNVYIKGEISNFKHHYTGHMYFTLKDDNSLIKCIMFKTYTATLNFIPKDGMQVLILGSVGVFERDGVYQVYCKAMAQEGIGDLYKRYEELKAKLEKDGYFDEKHKKAIPYMPENIGVLTSSTGSVIKDIINVSTRRNPKVHIKLYPIPVQGKDAAPEIADAIEFMNKLNNVDVIILARGGGSIEDLWPFNEEIVANAIYNSNIPIISAVGHETDFTIADFVADLRAPTPSAAAELAQPDVEELLWRIKDTQKRLRNLLSRKLELNIANYNKIMNSRVFTNPMQRVNDNYIIVDNYLKSLEKYINNIININKIKAAEILSKLDALSPLKTMNRGFCITEKQGKIVKSVNDLSTDDKINLKFFDGTKEAKII